MGAHDCYQFIYKEDRYNPGRMLPLCEGAEFRGVSKVHNAKSFRCESAASHYHCSRPYTTKECYEGCKKVKGGSDIAVLKLDKPVQFTDKIRPICLPANPSQEQFSNKPAVVAGWGYYNKFNNKSSTTPREAEVRVQPQMVCQGCMNQNWNDLLCKWSKNGVNYSREGWGADYHHATHICTVGVQEPWQGPRGGDSGSALNFKENGRFSNIYLHLFFREWTISDSGIIHY